MTRSKDDSFIWWTTVVISVAIGWFLAGIVGYYKGDHDARAEAREAGVGDWDEDGQWDWLPIKPSEDDGRPDRIWRRHLDR